MNKVMETIFARRSCRSYVTDKAVPEDALGAVLEAGRYAPSAMNTQSWRFTAVCGEAALDRLNDAMLARMDPAARDRAAGRADGRRVSPFYNAPVLIVVSLADGASVYPEADAACALENMFLAATSLGLGTCWINQLRGATRRDPHVGQLLTEFGLPEDHIVYGCCALGYADKEIPAKARAEATVRIVV